MFGDSLFKSRATAPQVESHPGGQAKLWHIYALFCGLLQLVPIALYAYDAFEFPLPKTLLAIQIIVVCLYPTFRYLTEEKIYPPIFPLVCLSYAYLFGVPVFTCYPLMEVVVGWTALSDADVIAALALSLLGACSLITAYYVFGNPRIQSRLPEIRLVPSKNKAFIHSIAVFMLYPLLSSLRPTIQQDYPQVLSIVNLLDNQMLVAIGLMSWLVYSTSKPRLMHKVFLCVLVAFQLFIGFSSTVLELPLVGICIVLIIKWTYTRRFPMTLMIIVMAVIFFLQPVKVEVREQNWFGDSAQSVSPIDKAGLWISRATEFWGDALSGNRTISDSTSKTLSRSDFIHQFAYVHSLTPSVIPYQYGQTYTFFLVSLVPRVLWPEKPVANANAFFGVTYGITTEEGAERSNFGVSLVGESFINFGIVGVMLIMMLQGALMKCLESIFGGANSGAGAQAVFLSCSIWFLNGVGSSAEIMFGGILQNLIGGCLLLLWARAPNPKYHSQLNEWVMTEAAAAPETAAFASPTTIP
jgi:hypothetical protein